MQLITRTAFAFVVAVAVAAMFATASPAAKKPKTLTIAKSGDLPLSAGEKVIAVWEFTVGNDMCRNEMTGNVTTNGAKIDTFTGSAGTFVCSSGRSAGFTSFNFGANGKGSASALQLPIGTCTFTATKLKGTNSVTGALTVSVSGKLKANKGCPEKSATLKTTATEILGPEEEFLQV